VVNTSLHDGRTDRPDLCLRVAAGDAASYECGHLRIAHELPETRTFEKTRTPVLTYHSGHAAPYVLIPLHVGLPAGGDTPTKVTVKVTVPGHAPWEGTWTGSAWTSGVTRRVTLGFDAAALTSGVYDYTLEVTNWYSSTPYATQGSGSFSVVNRVTSPFGRGWWMAGVEALDTASMTVVDGSGGVRRYTSAGTNRWAATPVDRPDSLVKSGSTFVRKLRGGAQVVFDGGGRHTKTIDALGRETVFTWSGGTLTTIRVPAHTTVNYALVYTSGFLTKVTAPGVRVTTISRSGAVVTGITDPGSAAVSFVTTSNRITSRTDRRGTVTAYAYDVNTRRLAQVTVNGTGLNLVTNVTPWEGRGWGSGTTARASSALSTEYTEVNGPLTEVTDIGRFWLDPYGAPRQIVSATSDTTVLSRGYTAFPSLVTSVRWPDQCRDRAVYNNRGNVRLAIRVNPFGKSPAQDDTTRYVYYGNTDARADYAKRIIPPEKDSVVLSYGSPGVLDWQQNARGIGGRVLFRYDTSKRLVAVQYPNGAIDSLTYDTTLGNIRTAITPLGFVTTSHRDAMGRDTMLVQPITASLSQTSRWAYNSRGLVSVERQSGPAFTYSCTSCVGSSGKAVPAEHLEVNYSYDAEGNVTQVARGGQAGGDLVSTFVYDRAHRKTSETNTGASAQTFVYDKAGNVTSWTRGGHTTAMKYDPMNRLVKRTLPPVALNQATCTAGSIRNSPCIIGLTFHSLAMPPDTQSYAYDRRGRMLAAHNREARVGRRYFPGGEMKNDTIRFRRFAGPSCPIGQCVDPEFTQLGGPVDDPYPDSLFTTYRYGISYTYDRNGRIKTRGYPSNASGAVSAAYTYFYWGGLEHVDGLLGSSTDRYTWAYNMSGQVTQVLHPGGLSEPFLYDLDSRLIRRKVGTVLNDTLHYDRRGKVTKAVLRQHNRESEQWYSGLGYVVASKWKAISGADFAVDEYRYDSHGNATWSRRRDALATGPERVHAYDGEVRLSEIFYGLGGNPPPGTNTYRDYASAGDVSFSSKTHQLQGASMHGLEQMRYYYGPDGRMRAMQRYGRWWDPATQAPTGFDDVWEEYMYDALGRRIVKYTEHEPFCDTRCAPAIERTIWDGAQVLVELRAPGTGSLNQQYGTGREHGRVSYLHGPGIDQPLALYRRDFLTSGTIRVRPRANWRGQYEGGVFSGGWPECNGSNSPSCVFTDWPAQKMHTYLDGQSRPLGDWLGSLVQDQREASGLLFRRNRYYDPATGQFTQQDPIGIAGGMNLYGFANGDPINFSDPFGLNPCLVPPVANACVGLAMAATAAVAHGASQILSDGRNGNFTQDIFEAGAQIANSLGDKVKRWIRTIGLAGGLLFPGEEPTSTIDPTPTDPSAPVEAPAPRPTPTDTIRGGGGGG
jgi:RHS repeat-associated protein